MILMFWKASISEVGRRLLGVSNDQRFPDILPELGSRKLAYPPCGKKIKSGFGMGYLSSQEGILRFPKCVIVMTSESTFHQRICRFGIPRSPESFNW